MDTVDASPLSSFFLSPLPLFRDFRAELQLAAQTWTQMLIIRPHVFNIYSHCKSIQGKH